MSNEPSSVEKLPITVQPWAHLWNFIFEKVHQAGMLGSAILIIVLGVYYAYPLMQKQIALQERTEVNIQSLGERLDKLHDQATKAMPMLEEATKAIPLLRQLNREAAVSNEQRNELSKRLGAE